MAAKLDGKTWLRYSISVWDDIEKSPEEKALNHPAMYPAALVTRLLQAYLRRDHGWVLDPFLGSGSTLVAARDAGASQRRWYYAGRRGERYRGGAEKKNI